MPNRDIFWAIRGDFGFYCGTSLTRVEAIASHVNGLYRFHPQPGLGRTALSKEEMQDWQKRYRAGDRAVRVEVRAIADGPAHD